MDKLVIFSKPVIWVMLSFIVAMYIADVILNRLLSKRRAQIEEFKVQGESNSDQNSVGYYRLLINIGRLKVFSVITAAINMVFHVMQLVALLYIKAKPEEVLFILLISIALALTVNMIKAEE